MSLECETCGNSVYEGHAPDCPRANRSKATKAADMQPAPATEQATLDAALADTDEVPHLIVFDDTEVKPELVIGSTRARYRFGQVSDRWNAHLYVKVQSSSRDDRYAAANAVLATQAERVQSSESLREAFDAAFLSWNGFHTKAELDAEWARGTLAGEMFRAGALARRATASQAEAPEAVHFYRQKGAKVWIECVTDPRSTFANSPAKDCMEYRTLFAANTKEGTQ